MYTKPGYELVSHGNVPVVVLMDRFLGVPKTETLAQVTRPWISSLRHGDLSQHVPIGRKKRRIPSEPSPGPETFLFPRCFGIRFPWSPDSMSPAPDSAPTPVPGREADSGDRTPNEEQRANAPSQDNIRASARPNRSQEPLNDTTGRPKRVFRKTPPRTRGRRWDVDAEETLGHVESMQAGAAGTRELPPDAAQSSLDFARTSRDDSRDATQPALDLPELFAPPPEDADAELDGFDDQSLSRAATTSTGSVPRDTHRRGRDADVESQHPRDDFSRLPRYSAQGGLM